MIEVRDVIQALRDETAKTSGTANAPPASADLQLTMAYLDYLRLDRATRRYLLIINHAR